jgi:hypothetical protein
VSEPVLVTIGRLAVEQVADYLLLDDSFLRRSVVAAADRLQPSAVAPASFRPYGTDTRGSSSKPTPERIIPLSPTVPITQSSTTSP